MHFIDKFDTEMFVIEVTVVYEMNSQKIKQEVWGSAKIGKRATLGSGAMVLTPLN